MIIPNEILKRLDWRVWLCFLTIMLFFIALPVNAEMWDNFDSYENEYNISLEADWETPGTSMFVSNDFSFSSPNSLTAYELVYSRATYKGMSSFSTGGGSFYFYIDNNQMTGDATFLFWLWQEGGGDTKQYAVLFSDNSLKLSETYFNLYNNDGSNTLLVFEDITKDVWHWFAYDVDIAGGEKIRYKLNESEWTEWFNTRGEGSGDVTKMGFEFHNNTPAYIDNISSNQDYEEEDPPEWWEEDFVNYWKEKNPYIRHRVNATYVDSDWWDTVILGPIFYDFNFSLKYNIWAPDDWNVRIYTSLDNVDWDWHASSTVGDAYSGFQKGLYFFTPIPLNDVSQVRYVDAYMYDENFVPHSMCQFKIVTDPEYLITMPAGVASTTFIWDEYVYDVESACDDVATSSGGWADDMRYAIECGFRKTLYWALNPKQDSYVSLMSALDQMQRQFPLSVYNQIDDFFDEVKNATTTGAVVAFLPPESAITIEGNFFDTTMLSDTWGSAFEYVYKSIIMIIYALGMLYIILRILRVYKKE